MTKSSMPIVHLQKIKTAEIKHFSLIIIGKECPLSGFEVESKSHHACVIESF